jgi:hypothetical protein
MSQLLMMVSKNSTIYYAMCYGLPCILLTLASIVYRPWKDHFKSDLRSDQDHLLKKDLRSDQDHIFLKIIFCPKCPLYEGQNFKTDKKSSLNF